MNSKFRWHCLSICSLLRCLGRSKSGPGLGLYVMYNNLDLSKSDAPLVSFTMCTSVSKKCFNLIFYNSLTENCRMSKETRDGKRRGNLQVSMVLQFERGATV